MPGASTSEAHHASVRTQRCDGCSTGAAGSAGTPSSMNGVVPPGQVDPRPHHGVGRQAAVVGPRRQHPDDRLRPGEHGLAGPLGPDAVDEDDADRRRVGDRRRGGRIAAVAGLRARRHDRRRCHGRDRRWRDAAAAVPQGPARAVPPADRRRLARSPPVGAAAWVVWAASCARAWRRSAARCAAWSSSFGIGCPGIILAPWPPAVRRASVARRLTGQQAVGEPDRVRDARRGPIDVDLAHDVRIASSGRPPAMMAMPRRVERAAATASSRSSSRAGSDADRASSRASLRARKRTRSAVGTSAPEVGHRPAALASGRGRGRRARACDARR